MINLSISNDNGQTKSFQEGILETSLKNAADINVDEIKKVWQDSSKGIGDKLKSLNDDGVDKARKAADQVDDVITKHAVDTRSIIARARNSVLQFPIYVPQTIRINEAHIIGKMFERVYTTLVQSVLSQNPIMNEEDANNLVFLKQFHTNIKEAADVLVNKYYEPIDAIDQMMCESVFFTQKLTENCTVSFSVVPCNDQDLILENARLMNEPLSGFMYLQEALNKKPEESLRDETIVTSGSTKVLSRDDVIDIAADMADLDRDTIELAKKSTEDIRKEVSSKMGECPKEKYDDKDRSKVINQNDIAKYKEDFRKELESKTNDLDDAKTTINDAIKDLKNQLPDIRISPEALSKKDPAEQKRIRNLQKKYGDLSFKNGQFRRQDTSQTKTWKPKDKETPVNRAVAPPTLNKDSEIKKFNGLLPYTMEATFRIRTKQGLDREIRYILGVKSVLHQFRTQDLADDLRELVTGNINTLQKVRYKTGEISFKDYFLNIKNLKADASKHVNYDKRWLNTLKRLGEYEKMNGSLMKKSVEAITGGKVPIPNGTMVLTQPDVTTITNQTGIDLSIVSNAKRLAKSLFLIGVVIVDSTRGTMRVLFPDSDSEWDVQSLAAIDAELAKTDNSQLMRELNHMVNR